MLLAGFDDLGAARSHILELLKAVSDDDLRIKLTPSESLARMAVMVPTLNQSDAPLMDLFERWARHASFYGDVLCGSGFVKIGGTWRNLITFFSPVRRGTDSPPMRVDYGDLLIVRTPVPMAETRAALLEVVRQGRLVLPERPEVSLPVSMTRSLVRRFGSRSIYRARFDTGYASLEYPFQITSTPDGQIPTGPVCSLSAPLYPHVYAAIEDLLRVRIANQGSPDLFALAPDYRARVDQVDLGGPEIVVTIQTFDNQRSEMIGKIYHEDVDGKVRHGDLIFDALQARFAVDREARRIMIALLSRSEGDLVDEWVYDPAAGATSGASFRTPEQDWESLIMQGESETVEFKSRADGLALAIEISAFANTHGGQILIGVTDTAEIEGCDLGKIGDTITRCIDARCEPKPDFKVSPVLIREKPVVVITVFEGAQKPYSIREHGVFVRSGATRRQATRTELDAMYPARPPSMIPWR